MNKFAAFVEEGGVVFIGFDDEIGRCVPRSFFTQLSRHTKIKWHAAYQEAGFQACMFQNPGKHRSRCRLPMRARHCKHMPALQDVLLQPLWPAGIARAAFQDGLHQRKLRRTIGQPSAADHIAHNVHIRLEMHLIRAKAFDQVNPQRTQLITHRWIHPRIAARHLVTRLTSERRYAAHERTANT